MCYYFQENNKLINLRGDTLKENRSIFFLSLLMLVIFISWLCIVWFTDLLPEDTNKINVTISSITATLAPIALIVTYSNYIRKSGVDLRIKLRLDKPRLKCSSNRLLMTRYIIVNHKDKNTYIPILYIVIDNEYAILINAEGFNVSPYIVENTLCSLGDEITVVDEPLPVSDIFIKYKTYRLGIDTFSEGSFISEEYYFDDKSKLRDNYPKRVFKSQKRFQDYKEINCKITDEAQDEINSVRQELSKGINKKRPR